MKTIVTTMNNGNLPNVFGVVDCNGTHYDVSKSERGAKQYAALNGFTRVSCRYRCGYNVAIIAERVNTPSGPKWVKL